MALWSPYSLLPTAQSVSYRWKPTKISCSPTELSPRFCTVRANIVTRVTRALAHLSLTAYTAGARSNCSLRDKLDHFNCCSHAASTSAHTDSSVQKPRVSGLAVKGCENYLALIFPVLMLLYLALEIGAVIFI